MKGLETLRNIRFRRGRIKGAVVQRRDQWTGCINLLIVRTRREGVHEIVTDHCRKYASQKSVYTKFLVIIRTMTDEEVIVAIQILKYSVKNKQ